MSDETRAERIAVLKAVWMDTTGDDPDDYALSGDDWCVGLDEEEAEEIVRLLEEEAEARTTQSRRNATIARLRPTETLYIRSMGKLLQVHAICQTDDEANILMAREDAWGVVAAFPGRIYLADVHDQGIKIAP